MSGSSAREMLLDPVPPAEPRLRVVVAPPRIVKRYANRKLYDTTASRYVKLDEIAELIRDGIEVRVVEHPSGRDITSAALAHIIFGEEATRSRRSADVLADVIRGAPAAGAPDPARRPQADELPEHRAAGRLDRALNQAHRAHVGTASMLDAVRGTIERLCSSAVERAEAAHEVCGGLSRARRDLERIARRLDVLHDRLVGLDS